MPIRVLHVINNLNSGGAEHLLTGLLPRLAQCGVECELLVLEPMRTPLYRVVQESGIVVHDGSNSGLRSPQQIAVAARLIRQGAFEAVHSHLFPAMAWTALACGATRFRKLLVTTEHSTSNRRRRRWFRPVDRAFYARYDSVVCVSAETRAALVDWHPGLRDRAVVIPNGIDLSRFTPQGRGGALERLMGGAGPILLSVGRLTRPKGFDILLHALAQVPEARLAIAGDGEERPRLEELIRSLGLGARVGLLGTRTDVPELMASADAYIQPSRWEGFGLAAVEAMASGLPLVVSDVDGLNQVAGDAALRVPPEDAGALAGSIARLLRSSQLRAELSRKGREISQRYSIDATARAHAEMYGGCPC